eukprot:m.299987 g.299987  ORF g.299987 m.299987 type:complete len:74 (-) comp20123_c1_seq41:11-232(-)
MNAEFGDDALSSLPFLVNSRLMHRVHCCKHHPVAQELQGTLCACEHLPVTSPSTHVDTVPQFCHFVQCPVLQK